MNLVSEARQLKFLDRSNVEYPCSTREDRILVFLIVIIAQLQTHT